MHSFAKPQLVYLAFGPEIYQTEALFSIASAISRTEPREIAKFDIQVFTDHPELYKKLPVTPHTIPEHWKGPHSYHFRLKHCALKHVLEKHEKAILIDTDTFFKKSPDELFERVDTKHLLCNALGARVQDLPETQIIHACKNKGYIVEKTITTNSGVIGLTSESLGVLEKSIAMMDDLYPEFQSFYTLEEFCLAMAVSQTALELCECTDIIHHYWSRKTHFRAKISAWHSKHHAEPLSALAIEDLGQVNDRLPKTVQPLRTLHKLVTLMLPETQQQLVRELLHGCANHANEFDNACRQVWWSKALENFEKHTGSPLRKQEIKDLLSKKIFKILSGKRYSEMSTYIYNTLENPQESEHKK